MKTLSELRQYIYDFLDVESFDIPEALLNTWAKEGYDRIIKMERRIPHFEDTFAAVTTSGIGSVTRPAELDSTGWVTADGRILEPLDHRLAYDEFVGWDGAAHEGEPTHYSTHGDQLHLWPIPTSEMTVTIHGWRRPLAWVANAGRPDMPEHFESVLLSFMLYRAYGHQGLIEDAQAERAEFESQLGQLHQWETSMPTDRPMIMNGGTRRGRSGPAPLTFPIVMG